MYRLLFQSGRYQGKRLVVRQAVTLVGHDAECHLLLPDDNRLAPRHARFEERGTGVFLSSLSAEQPVERNGQPLRDTVRLAHNDLLVIGQTRIQFQDIIAPHTRLSPSAGILQPTTLLLAVGIIVLELGLLTFLVNWQQVIIRPETEARDLARAEVLRASLDAEKAALTSTVSVAKSAASVVTLPGTEPVVTVVQTNADGTLASVPATPSSASANVLAVLDEADFTPANTNAFSAPPPPLSTSDPSIEEAQRMLAEAVSAAQFADYAKALRLLNQIHENTPNFLPAHIEHARLLEASGDLEGAQQRWTQIMGIAPAGSDSRAKAREERQRLTRLQTLQTQILQLPQTPNLNALPRHIRILEPDLQKMPADTDIAEMRVLNTTLEMAPGAPLFKDAAIQVFLTFYDIDANGIIQPTHAITTPSPIALGSAFADRRSLPLNATYVVPRGLRTQTETAHQTAYYGYTLHLFAGRILEDAIAKPKKLLELPIRFPPPGLPEP